MEKLKERLSILLSKEKLLNKLHGDDNSSFEMQRTITCPLKPTQLPKKFSETKNQNINFETNQTER